MSSKICDAAERGATLPLIAVLGAGRSGTNLLANVLDAEPSLHNTVENRYVWNYGQKSLAHDVRGPEDATPANAAFIRRFFQTIADKKGTLPVDKTPSNVFRVGFLKAVFPNVKLIHIVRDGRDNVFSRLREWRGGNAVVARQKETGKVEVRDDFRAAFLRRRWVRFIELMAGDSLPLRRLPIFFFDNLGTFASQAMTKQPVRYGERFPGMAAHLRVYGPIVTSAAQWREGVCHAIFEGRCLGDNAYLEIRYEDLLFEPAREWARIAAFLNLPEEGLGLTRLIESLKPRPSRAWDDDERLTFIKTVEPHIRPTNEFLGYGWS